MLAYGLKSEDVEQYLNDLELAKFFDQVEKELKEPELIKVASNFIANDIAGQRKKVSGLPAGEAGWLPEVKVFTEIVRLYQAGKLPSPQAKSSILSGRVAEVMNDDSLGELVKKIIAENPKAIAEYKAGKAASLQFLIGQGMKKSKGSANPGLLKKLFEEVLALI